MIIYLLLFIIFLDSIPRSSKTRDQDLLCTKAFPLLARSLAAQSTLGPEEGWCGYKKENVTNK